MSRLTRCLIAGAALTLTSLAGCALPSATATKGLTSQDIASACDVSGLLESERNRVITLADTLLDARPRTVTADRSNRSSGGPNDFYSEGDYWWPVEGDPDAPYERRDGQTNPDNFIAHRLSMMRLSDHVGVLVSAWRLTGETRYADAAVRHLRAWFVTPATRMTPALLYAQAVKGRYTGRSIGLIDTLHLVEPARGAKLLIDAGLIPEDDARAIVDWFATYATWMNTHPYGIEERDWYNNHAIAWSLQVAAFADLAGDEALLDLVRTRFRDIYLSQMMDARGAFPEEISRTKPYGYSLFVIDLMAGIATIASTPENNLWTARAEDGRSMSLGLAFILPFIADKSAWPYGRDIQYWEDWPVRHPVLIQGGIALADCAAFNLALSLPAESDVYEVRRNWPLRHPILWLDNVAPDR